MRLYWSPEKHAIVTSEGEIIENISNYNVTYDRIPVSEMGRMGHSIYIEGRMTVEACFDVDVWETPVDPTAAINGLLELEKQLDDN